MLPEPCDSNDCLLTRTSLRARIADLERQLIAAKATLGEVRHGLGGQLAEANKKVERLVMVLRAKEPCSAMSVDGLRCQRRYAHTGSNHETTRGANICWPDSERDDSRSEKLEREIMARITTLAETSPGGGS